MFLFRYILAFCASFLRILTTLADKLLVAGLLLYLALRGIDWMVFLSNLRKAKYAYLPIDVLWSSLGFFIRALRWRVLLSAEKPISRVDVFWPI